MSTNEPRINFNISLAKWFWAILNNFAFLLIAFLQSKKSVFEILFILIEDDIYFCFDFLIRYFGSMNDLWSFINEIFSL